MHPRIHQLFYRRPFVDKTLCHLMRRRLTLPTLSLAEYFPDFDEQAVSIRQVPRGDWSTPMADVVMLLKLAVCARPGRLMEVGSYRGYTSLFLAQHTADDARIVTVDSYPEHGEAYHGTPSAAKIERRIGETTAALFAADAPGSYDFIFVDANHAYQGVKGDTELTLPLIAKDGYIVWHDYANWGYFSGINGVPEYLAELAASGLQIARVAGSDLAVHSPAWNDPGSPAGARFRQAIGQGATAEGRSYDPWKFDGVRG